MDDALLDRMRSLTTSGVSDALDRLRIGGQCHGLRAVTVDRHLSGPAFTVRFAPVSANSQATVGDYLDDVPPGHVVAHSIEARELQIRAAVRNGMSLSLARSQHGYFELQREGSR